MEKIKLNNEAYELFDKANDAFCKMLAADGADEAIMEFSHEVTEMMTPFTRVKDILNLLYAFTQKTYYKKTECYKTWLECDAAFTKAYEKAEEEEVGNGTKEDLH
jgi:hypothetical protein